MQDTSFGYSREITHGGDCVLSYLEKGTPSGLEQGPIIREEHLKELMLRGGYTDLALGVLRGGGHAFVERSDTFNSRVTIPTRYGLDVGEYQGIPLIRRVLRDCRPDYEVEEQDVLRLHVLSQLDQLPKLKWDLSKIGFDWFSLDIWGLTPDDAKVRYLLNPVKQTVYQHGWYTVDELEGILYDEGPVLAKNNSKTPNTKRKAQPYKVYYEEMLKAKGNPRNQLDKQILRVALMGCVFPDMVAQYYARYKDLIAD